MEFFFYGVGRKFSCCMRCKEIPVSIFRVLFYSCTDYFPFLINKLRIIDYKYYPKSDIILYHLI
jgi:hypothetical protein